MIPVEQTKLGKDGNCFAACIASIFELSLEEIPECDGGRWNTALYNWFTERNLAVCNRYFREGEPRRINEMGYGILTAKSPRTEGYHAVVVYKGEVVFDPHPERDMGIGAWWFYTYFYVLDPGRILQNDELVKVLDSMAGIDAPHALNGKILTPVERVRALLKNTQATRQ